ncbi:MAG: hypothetical protein V3V92_00650, partial [Candidatus Hydrothermarchaeales archaeon]
MKNIVKFSAVFVIFLLIVQAVPASELDRPIYDILSEEQSEINKLIDQVGIPPGLTGFASARLNINIDDEKVGVVLSNGKILEVAKGGIDNPTTEIWTTKEFILDVASSEKPMSVIASGLRSGELRKKDYGASNAIKGMIASNLMLVSDVLNPPKETRERVSGNINDVGINPESGSYVINPATSGLRRSHIEIDSKEGKDVGGEGVKLTEYAGFDAGVAPLGLKDWEVVDGEVSLGTFVNLEAPVSDIESTMIAIKYSEGEVSERGLSEDGIYMKWYDDDSNSETYGMWITLVEGNPSWVKSIKIDKEQNVIWLVTSHLSVYGIGGSVYGRGGSVYGRSGSVVGPPPAQLVVEIPVTLAPIEPIKEPERPSIVPLIGLAAMVLGILLLPAIVAFLLVKKVLKRGKKEEAEGEKKEEAEGEESEEVTEEEPEAGT